MFPVAAENETLGKCQVRIRGLTPPARQEPYLPNTSDMSSARVMGLSRKPPRMELVMVIAAAEVVIGLGLVVAIFRSRTNLDVDELSSMKG